MFQKHTIPPQPGMPFKRNHHFPDLEKMNVHIPATAIPLPGSGNAAKRRIFLNSFDASVSLSFLFFLSISSGSLVSTSSNMYLAGR